MTYIKPIVEPFFKLLLSSCAEADEYIFPRFIRNISCALEYTEQSETAAGRYPGSGLLNCLPRLNTRQIVA